MITTTPPIAVDPEHLRQALDLAPPRLPNPLGLAAEGLKLAAVLILVAPMPGEAQQGVLLTERSAQLQMHAGQISLPGGRVDPGDADTQATALREAEEEVGLARDRITLLGRADDQSTTTGYKMESYLAWAADTPALTADPREVERILWLPLATLAGDEPPGRYEFHRGGKRLWTPAFRVQTGAGEAVVWGATAGLLAQFRARLRAVIAGEAFP